MALLKKYTARGIDDVFSTIVTFLTSDPGTPGSDWVFMQIIEHYLALMILNGLFLEIQVRVTMKIYMLVFTV